MSVRPKYALMDKKLSWSDAEQNCKDWGGHLASLHSKEEYDNVDDENERCGCWC